MSFEETRQFTNQIAHQSMFAPPGFSFESPFAYSSMSNGAEGQSSSFPMNMPIQASMSMGADVKAEMNRPSSSGGVQNQSMASGISGFGQVQDSNMWTMPSQGTSQGKKDQSMFDMFSAPPVQLSTGDRFSQLLERKLGMGPQTPVSAFPPYEITSSQTQQSNQLNSMPINYPQFPPMPSQDNFSWDRLAVETNLQDYNQVQIQPDLVAPIPAAYLQYNPSPMMANYEASTSQGYMRSSASFPSGNGTHQGFSPMQNQPQPFMASLPNPYVSYKDGFSAPTMTNPAFPIQASPMSTSNRSSPSSQSNQLATPQTSSHTMMSDSSWSSSFVSQGHLAPPDAQARVHMGSVPPPTFNRGPTADHMQMHPSYNQVRPMPEASSSAPPMGASERTRLSAMGATLASAPRPKGVKQSQSHPALAVGPNGMWSRDMIASSSSQSIASSNHPYPMSTQVQGGQSHLVHPLPLPLPASLPPAPTVAKRSRSQSSSPHSQSHGSSHLSPDHTETNATSGSVSKHTPKRPKMSIPHPMPMPPSSTEENEDGERKVIIACHTCRARKLKCDGAKPKCFHCSRRNEDGCSYDVVLRRRGPGRKNKSKQKSTDGGGSEGSVEDDQGNRSAH